MQNLKQAIRERAYHLWIDSGRLDGNAESHWLAAQREILGLSLSTVGRVGEAEPPKAKATNRSRKRRRAA
jgi:Protein of unknown function (DUF2934)